MSTKHHSFFASTTGLLFACTVSCLLWGSAFPCIKIGYQLMGLVGAPIESLLVFAGTRFVISGGMVILGLALVQGKACLPHWHDAKPIALLALFQTILQYVLFYLGLAKAAGITGSIVEASGSFVCVLMSALLFRSEKLTSGKVWGCIIGFAGVIAVCVAAGGGLGFSLEGEGLVMLSAACAATSTNLAKGFAQKHNPVLLSAWQFFFGGLVMLVLGLTAGGRMAPADMANPLPAVALMGYLALISAGAYTLWSLALRENPVSRVSVFGFLNPVFGVILSMLLLNEADALHPLVAVGALALVSLGIVIVNHESE